MITIHVSENGSTVVQDDTGTSEGGGQITIDITANDQPSPGETWNLQTREFVRLPENGAAVFGSIIYTPDAGFEGTDTLSYRICDTGGFCSVGEVTITITAPEVEAELLPATGFAPGRETLLPVQSIEYDELGSLWLEIPALGIKAPIVGVPESGASWDTTWLGDSIGYLQDSSFPTWQGNTLLSAHVYNHLGQPAPFHNLHHLRYNHTIILHAWGSEYIYKVRSSKAVRPDDLSIMKHEELDWLTLITCLDYDVKTDAYLRRTVVRAVLVGVND